MKNKSNKIISIVIASLVIIVGVLGLKTFTTKNVEETSVYSERRDVFDKIKNENVANIIYEATSQIHKGPGPSPKKIAYITIDDGPSKYTNEILKTLKKNDIKATFFMIEGNMKNHKEEVKNVQKEGHSVGFHSVSHDIKQLYKSPETTLNEFETCNNTFYDITGDVSKLIRLPYGSKPYMPDGSHDILDQNGYLMWDWNLDTEDWRATTDKIVSNVLYYGRDRQHLVILMHEKEQTVKALDGMIKILKERGYTILPIKEYMKPMNFWDKNL
ncbi:polysaccharide deacetylase family protein [Clostridium sp. CCUG 7971]|uniref:polysaccharide deacetylase family protein n=1 Tax=Clostridium sp. CCUG 7971 TaxID=2811414 RepID=UPI001ABB8D8A|nr:polysaccharide deacetylase family protein [Clostridium sp. CCUG 7971]MBO3445344.1 polysaccharide deacetylase [Clostridium sp. CCUG 7971]